MPQDDFVPRSKRDIHYYGAVEPERTRQLVEGNMEAIELIIDRVGLHDTLALMAEICREKASHIDTNWQDTRLARKWDRAADAIDKVAYGKTIQAVP